MLLFSHLKKDNNSFFYEASRIVTNSDNTVMHSKQVREIKFKFQVKSSYLILEHTENLACGIVF